MPPATYQNYDYTASGIDGFLSRSIEQVSWQTTLDAAISIPGNGGNNLSNYPPAANNNAVRFDGVQTSGSLGDNMQVGNISLNGSTGTITLSDGVNNRLLIGEQAGGF